MRRKQEGELRSQGSVGAEAMRAGAGVSREVAESGKMGVAEGLHNGGGSATAWSPE